MSIELLPPGTDVLKARAQEMAHNLASTGRATLSRGEVSAAQTAGALASRLLASRERLGALDGVQVPNAVALEALAHELAGRPIPSFDLGYNRPWAFLATMAFETLSAESRLMALEGTPPVVSRDAPEGLDRLVLELAVDGYVHRHFERFWQTMEMLVPRVLSIAARTGALEAARVPASGKGG